MNNENLYKEIDEAVNAANDALYHLGNAEEVLKSARNWGIADLLGGQMIISAVKSGKMQQAEVEMEAAGKSLRKLNRELGDVGEFRTIGGDFTTLLGTIDIFLDNPISDLMTQSRINQSLKEVQHAIAQVEGVLDALDEIAAERG
jgi:hypothetical protein